ncbi:hypothetical protein [Planomonospora algeriensis]
MIFAQRTSGIPLRCPVLQGLGDGGELAQRRLQVLARTPSQVTEEEAGAIGARYGLL